MDMADGGVARDSHLTYVGEDSVLELHSQICLSRYGVPLWS